MGSLFGGRSPRVPEVSAPPRLNNVAGAVDRESRGALARQQRRRDIAAQDDRSLLGTADSARTTQSLLANVNKTRSELTTRATRIQDTIQAEEDRINSEQEQNRRLQIATNRAQSLYPTTSRNRTFRNRNKQLQKAEIERILSEEGDTL